MKKVMVAASALLMVGSLGAAPLAATAATFDCSKAAIWAYDGGTNELRKINPFGKVVSTVTLDTPGTNSGDIAISADYAHAYLITADNGVESYNTNTGVADAGYPKAITGAWADDFSNWSYAAGVIDGGNIIVNGGVSYEFYSIDPATGASTVWADLQANGDSGLPDGEPTGGEWTAGADVVQAVDGSVYVLAQNSNYENDLLVKINPADTTQMTVVGMLPDSVNSSWGLARAGDNMYTTDGNGTHIFQLGAIPSIKSIAKLTAIDAGNFGDGTLWGLAGTNDSSPGATNCTFDIAAGDPTLAETGAGDNTLLGFLGLGLVGVGASVVRSSRRKQSNI